MVEVAEALEEAVLPEAASEEVAAVAGNPKKLVVHQGLEKRIRRKINCCERSLIT